MGLFTKAAMVCALGGVSVAALASTRIGSHVSYRVERAWERAEANIPMDHEIGRIKKEVAKLDKDIDKAKGQLAEQIVAERLQREAQENLKRSIDKYEALVRKQAEAIKETKEGERVKLDGRTMSVNRAKEVLEGDVARLKNMRKEVAAQESMLSTHEKSRIILEQQLHAMIAQKSEMKAAVTDFEAQVRMVKLQQIESRYQDDGSRLADIKQSMKDLQKKLEIQKEKLKLSETYSSESIASTRSVDEILADLDAKDTKSANKD